jgi:outer membrane lipoprotein-sorting protein
MKRNRYILPLGALLAVLALGAVVVMVRANADDMLHQAARLMADAQTGHAVIKLQVTMPDESASGTVEVWGQRDAGPDGEPAFHVKVLESDKTEAQGMVAVSDGGKVWIWKPTEKKVYVGTHDELKAKMAEHKEGFEYGDIDRPVYSEENMPQTPEEAVDKLLEYFKAERNGGEEVAGTAAEKLHLVPKPEQMPEEFRANGGSVYVWLRSSDHAPLAAEYLGGAVGYAKFTVTSLELDEALPKDIFTFEIPEGAEVIRLAEIDPPASLTVEEAANAADFQVLWPAELPAEARLAGTNEVRGAIVQHYRLADGASFTIAQGAADAAETPGEDGQIVAVRAGEGRIFSSEDGRRTLLTWTEGEVTFWVGGDLTPAEALAIAESLN